MSAHTDPDERGDPNPLPIPHLYFKGLGEGTAGNRLVVASGMSGGQVVTQYTMPRRGEVQATVFAPTDQLHFVDSEGCYTRGNKSEPDPTQVRVIPFNSKWVAELLLKGKTQPNHVGMRLAPLHPCWRAPVTCNACLQVFSSPSENPVAWINHLGWAIAKNRDCEFVCFDCAWEKLNTLTQGESFLFRHKMP